MLTININDIYDKAESFIDDQLKEPNSVLSKAKYNIEHFNIVKLKQDQINIIDHININFKEFILQTPIEQDKFIGKWKRTNPIMFYDSKKKGKKKTTTFGDDLLKALNYNLFRKDLCVEFAKVIGIKTCPYCNAMLAISLNDNKARFQLDHFYPKSRYPYLSISFFNLIPSCNNCNHIKGDKDVSLKNNFNLYSTEPAKEIFKFTLDRADIIRTLTGIKENELKVYFTHTEKEHESFVKKHDKAFHIQEIYDTQNDVALEMLWKTQAYNKANIDELAALLKIVPKDVKRMIVGNYIDFQEIHKRPLSKYMQDIAKDLKLI